MFFIKYAKQRFKQYTGKGLIPKKGVIVEDTGLSSGFTLNNHIQTNVSMEFTQKPFEINVKFNVTTKQINAAVLLSGVSPKYTFIIFYDIYNGKRIIGFNSWKNNIMYFSHFITLDEKEDPVNNLNSWYCLNVVYTGTQYKLILECEDINLKKSLIADNPKPCNYISDDYVIIGADSDVPDYPYSFGFIDLSETYIRTYPDYSVLSDWNL